MIKKPYKEWETMSLLERTVRIIVLIGLVVGLLIGFIAGVFMSNRGPY